MYKFIEVKSGARKILINVNSIDVIYAKVFKDDNVQIHTKNRTVVTNESYNRLKKKIEEAQFINVLAKESKDE
jgi:DNA-binding LytR/AlgR family response regulator